MAEKTENSVPGEAAALIASLVQQNARDLAYTTNTLLDSYRQDALVAQATLLCIREVVSGLLSGDFMPTPAAIERALYPSERLVGLYVEHIRNGGRP